VDTDELRARLASVEDRMQLLQDEVDSIRLALQKSTPAAAADSPSATTRPRDPFPRAQPREPVTPARPREPFPHAPPRPAPPRPRREVDLTELLGAQALAWAGGVVTLLGVVFFFVLAVNRGWIGPGTRVACGATVSTFVFAAGLWLHRRFEETYSSLAAVGTGIAGGYATLAAATVLYDLVPKPLALVVAAGIAGAALTVALVWRAELVAALGLVGAIAAPALLAVDGGLTAMGTGFAAVMTAAALAVGVRMRWPWLLTAAGVASAPQIVALVLDAQRRDGGAIAMACVFVLLYLAAAIGEQLMKRDDALAQLPTLFVLGSIGVAWLAAARLFGPADGVSAGIALLVVAAGFAAATVAVWIRGQSELGTLLGTIALAAAAVGVADALTGATLAYTFAAEAAVLAVAARRLREPRILLGALAYLAFALTHALVFDSPPSSLFEAAHDPASGAGALASAAFAALVVGWLARTPWNESSERGVLRFIAPVVAALRAHVEELRVVAWTAAALLVVNTVSLLVLELFEAAWPHGGIVASFHRGQVAMTGLWALGGLAAVVVASRRRAATARLLAFGWLALTALKATAYDGTQLMGLGFSLAFLMLAAALLLAGFVGELLESRRQPGGETVAAVAGAIVFAVVSTHPIEGEPGRGLALLAIALVLLAFAASVFPNARFRDLSTLLWAPALGLAVVAGGLLLHGAWLTLAWAAGAAALAGVAVALREKRLQVASFAYLVLTAGAAFDEAPPSHLVMARTHPAHGILGLLLLIAAAVALAWASRDGHAAAAGATGYDETAGWLDERQEHWRAGSLWAAGVIAVYTASLAILELSVRISSASLHTDFQRGHTAVSALWGALGLGLLYVGLRRRQSPLRLGGFALFAVSLGKLFLYDLSQLSSITRALSFLAVGAVLLLAGFFTQRLSATSRGA
jgi:uncharacterized membrane protein